MALFTNEELADLRAKIKDVKFGMFTVRELSGLLTSRPLTSQQLDEQGNLWFFVSDEEGFTRELAHEGSVNVSYADVDDHLYVSVSGRAELVRDRAKAEELFNPAVKAWFPQGLDDPHLVLLKVAVSAAEYWDTGNSKMVSLFAMAKAAITGEKPKTVGEHKTLGQ
jgi:general stress protein 26